jgi:hypothetical protein
MKKCLLVVLFISLSAIPTVFGDDCFPTCNADYDEWVAEGKPAAWCYPRQCHGDADGISIEIPPLSGNKWYVNLLDLNLLKNVWKIKEPPVGPGLIPAQLGADFDHRKAGSPFTGYWRVSFNDVQIMKPYYNKSAALVPTDCQDCGTIEPKYSLPLINLKVDSGSGYVDPGADISLEGGQKVWIGEASSSSSCYYDVFIAITDGLDYSDWTSETFIDPDDYYDPSYTTTWDYYAPNPGAGHTIDAWHLNTSPGGLNEIGEGVHAALEYEQTGCGDVTVCLYDEFFDDGPKDTLTIYGPDLYLTAPNGGEILPAGQSFEITWLSKAYITNVRLQYSINNGTDWADIDSNTPNTGSYMWEVPDVQSTQCLVRVSDAFNPAVDDQSNEIFTINIPDTLTLIGPNGGENLLSGSASPIQWSSTGQIENISIDYSLDDGQNWTTITATTANDGLFEWNPVPDANSMNCRIRIKDPLSDVKDISDGTFTLFTCQLPSIPGDINGDCYVNLADLVILSQHWLVSGSSLEDQGDINGDTHINLTDFSILSQYWLVCGNPLDSQCDLDSVNWIENFDDNDISDWTIENPYPSGALPMTLQLSNAQAVSPAYSIRISAPSENGYGALANGPVLPLDFSQPYTIRFQFRYNNLHWFYLVLYGPVALIADYSGGYVQYRYGTGWSTLNTVSFGTMCPANTWTAFCIEVRPSAQQYDLYVNDVFRGTASYTTYDSGYRGFHFRDVETGSYINEGYYDDIMITGKRLW